MSAGLSPAGIIAPLTKKVMAEKNIDVSGQFPKGLEAIPPGTELVINMSGQRMPVPPGTRIEEWKVLDPIGLSEDIFQQVASEIEQRVMRLVLSLRALQHGPKPTTARPI